MPVLLAPEDMPDRKHPVFKTTIMKSNEASDGTQVYPYVYIRVNFHLNVMVMHKTKDSHHFCTTYHFLFMYQVTEKLWRLNIHEPIIWALANFYKSIRVDSIPGSSGTAQVDPEIQLE